MIESLKILDNNKAKRVILNELLKKFDYLNNLEKMCNATSYIITDSLTVNYVRIDNDEIVRKIEDAIKEMIEKTRQEIIELETQYFELTK